MLIKVSADAKSTHYGHVVGGVVVGVGGGVVVGVGVGGGGVVVVVVGGGGVVVAAVVIMAMKTNQYCFFTKSCCQRRFCAKRTGVQRQDAEH